MLSISIKNYDKLSELTLKLSMLTFLQGLIISDDYIEYGEGFESVFTYAREFIYDEQRKTVLELRSVIDSEAFIELPRK